MSSQKNLKKVFGSAFNLTKATRSAAAAQVAEASKYIDLSTILGMQRTALIMNSS